MGGRATQGIGLGAELAPPVKRGERWRRGQDFTGAAVNRNYLSEKQNALHYGLAYGCSHIRPAKGVSSGCFQKDKSELLPMCERAHPTLACPDVQANYGSAFNFLSFVCNSCIRRCSAERPSCNSASRCRIGCCRRATSFSSVLLSDSFRPVISSSSCGSVGAVG